ncbi:hypothetical protein BD769DRAFT_1429603 [Suillus cothurnatus]|nr:hypothetical protein BD769DRAFT_1429603 [Suillus cothurnatus]
MQYICLYSFLVSGRCFTESCSTSFAATWNSFSQVSSNVHGNGVYVCATESCGYRDIIRWQYQVFVFFSCDLMGANIRREQLSRWWCGR